MKRATPTQMNHPINIIASSSCLPLSVKVAYSSDDSVKAVLLKDKTAKAEPGSKPQQYIEVGGVINSVQLLAMR